jgi:hypothetical protein
MGHHIFLDERNIFNNATRYAGNRRRFHISLQLTLTAQIRCPGILTPATSASIPRFAVHLCNLSY